MTGGDFLPLPQSDTPPKGPGPSRVSNSINDPSKYSVCKDICGVHKKLSVFP